MTTPVLDLAFAALSDPTRREIVQRLGISPDNVYARRSRGGKQMERILRGLGA